MAESVGVSILAQLLDDGSNRPRHLRGSSAGTAPRIAGNKSAPSRPGSSGDRCQYPAGCSDVVAVAATIWSAKSDHCEAVGPDEGANTRAARRRPAAQISRLWVQTRSSISQIPASASCHRFAMASAATCAAC